MRNVVAVLICLSVILTCWANGFGAQLPDADHELIKGAGVPLYSEAIFVNGNREVGFRFATSGAVEEVRAWYLARLAGWSLNSNYGGWILYDGKPGLGLADLMMAVKQVQIQKNLNMSAWFGVDKARTTEIVIFIPGR